MVQTHEWMFYEVMWRAKARGEVMPLPWWIQQYFRRWSDSYDGGLFSSKEAAFASNANYRYWNMVGVKDHHQESLIGQGGEIEPVYDNYALSFFLFSPQTKELHFPQFPKANASQLPLEQQLEDRYLPVVKTTYRSPIGIEVEEKVIATTIGERQRSVVLARFTAQLSSSTSTEAWLCLAVSPTGPTGFERHDKAGRYSSDKRLTLLKYLPAERLVEVNTRWGPLFSTSPVSFGLYGNEHSSYNPDHYLDYSAYQDLASNGSLNGRDTTADRIAGLCTGIFAWPLNLSPSNPSFSLDVKLPVDDYRGADDLQELQSAAPNTLEANNRSFWINKLDNSGFQASLPPRVAHLFDLFRICRANLLILADDGQIHPGPTIYDSFWVRDSSVEGIACALSGDQDLSEQQFGRHYPNVFNFDFERLGPVSLRGFFGGEHEKNDREWDSNGQALWALGRFDRILGPSRSFGAGMFYPYILEGARWLRDNRSVYGLLHSGWSAEHIGDKDKPHYWDDFWGIAGLWEAAKLAERIGAGPEAAEIWGIYNDLKQATADSIRWVLGEQAQRGFWETFIPTGPGDVGRLDSTMIGALAYFHPCRLYMGNKLGEDIDLAARLTLETIWGRFMDGGGFRHDSAWNCFGPYLTLQLAHSFLLIGDINRMDQCLRWVVDNAGYSRVSRYDGSSDFWQVVLGAWNEQHCYPIAKDFAEIPGRWWYMGDIPHGWACAEFMTLMRDILFFEADEDGSPQIYLTPGVMPHWLGDGQSVRVANAPTIFTSQFGFQLSHNQTNKTVEIEILQQPPGNVSFIYPCPFGSVVSVSADGNSLAVTGNNVRLPAGMRQATVSYL